MLISCLDDAIYEYITHSEVWPEHTEVVFSGHWYVRLQSYGIREWRVCLVREHDHLRTA